MDDLVEKFVKRYFGKRSDIYHVVQTLLDLSMTIELTRFNKGYSHPQQQATCNYLMGALFSKGAERIDLTQATFDKVGQVYDVVGKSPNTYDWYAPKVEVLARQMLNLYATKLWGESLSLPDICPALDRLQGEVPDLNRTIRDMMQQLLSLRTYGVKSCFFQDGVLHAESDAWIFTDMSGLSELLPGGYFRQFSDRFLAIISLTRKDSIQGLQWQKKSTKFSQNIDLPTDTSFRWAMDGEGELYAISLYSSMPLRQIFASMGKESEYELLRLSHVLRLYDLVVPLTMQAKLPALPDEPKEPAKPGEQGRIILPGAAQLVTRDLVIPRVRLLDNPAVVEKALRREVEEAQQETERQAKKKIGKYEMPGFVRRLPKGHHTSDSARENAWKERRITLQEGQTYVKTHDRGAGELSPVIYRAKPRKK